MTNKKHGDRNDGYLIPETDPIHMIMPYLMGERADNEALLNDTFDMSAIDKYLAKKNETAEHHYTYFHVIIAALAKTIKIRPLLNRFIISNRFYDRKEISFTFIAKNKMADNGNESVLIITADDTDEAIIDQIHDKICAEVYKVRNENQVDGTTEQVSWLTKIPRPILRLVVKILFRLNGKDRLPKALRSFDPYRTSVFLSNLGSINMEASYHHLINWSTNSIFAITNKVKKRPFFNDDGSYTMRNSMSIGFTIDERIADGFYFAKSIIIFKYILNHPEILDEPLSAEFDYQKVFDE